MIRDDMAFRMSLRAVLEADQGLAIQSEATVYIRSLEGGLVVAGILADDGAIIEEFEFGCNVDAAIEYFCTERSRRCHGASDT